MKEVAVGIITKDGRVLACQRTGKVAYALKWEFPGGKIEPGESPSDALRRELKEELNIDAEIGEEFHRQEWDYPNEQDRDRAGSSFRVFYFSVSSFRGTILNRAFQQLRWVSPGELSDMDILEGNRETVNLLIADAERKSV